MRTTKYDLQVFQLFTCYQLHSLSPLWLMHPAAHILKPTDTGHMCISRAKQLLEIPAFQLDRS